MSSKIKFSLFPTHPDRINKCKPWPNTTIADYLSWMVSYVDNLDSNEAATKAQISCINRLYPLKKWQKTLKHKSVIKTTQKKIAEQVYLGKSIHLYAEQNALATNPTKAKSTKRTKPDKKLIQRINTTDIDFDQKSVSPTTSLSKFPSKRSAPVPLANNPPTNQPFNINDMVQSPQFVSFFSNMTTKAVQQALAAQPNNNIININDDNLSQQPSFIPPPKRQQINKGELPPNPFIGYQLDPLLQPKPKVV